MHAYVRECMRQGMSIGFVPTMGALHRGHLSLVERSVEENDITVVSIFVNPTQFGPGEDFEKYPRDLEGDVEKLRSLGVQGVFAPSSDDLYPPGYRTYVNVEELTRGLCGAFRPGHFRGVATVVAKLFNIVRPDRAYFGQKDYQQVRVIQAMARDLDTGVDVIMCPTVREEDGLAMSSRNAYLSPEERSAATVIYRALTEVAERLSSGDVPVGDASSALRRILSSEPLVEDIQYASAYHPESLDELDRDYRGEVLLAVALRIGGTRLIDNMLCNV